MKYIQAWPFARTPSNPHIPHFFSLLSAHLTEAVIRFT